jgi:hypothetical protein
MSRGSLFSEDKDHFAELLDLFLEPFQVERAAEVL